MGACSPMRGAVVVHGGHVMQEKQQDCVAVTGGTPPAVQLMEERGAGEGYHSHLWDHRSPGKL